MRLPMRLPMRRVPPPPLLLLLLLQAGKTYDVDLKIDVQEIERIGALDEPLNLHKTLTLKIVGAADAAYAARSDAELKKRLRLTITKEEVYLGDFEVTDNAVNQAMMQLRESTMEADANAANVVLQDYSKVSRLEPPTA